MIFGEERALKITTPDDLIRAERYLLGDEHREMRVGIGTDAHAFLLIHLVHSHLPVLSGLARLASMATLMAMLRHTRSAMHS